MRVFKKKAKRWEGPGRPPAVALAGQSTVAGQRGRIREAIAAEGVTPGLRVSDPRDACELEADRVAAAVVRGAGPALTPVSAILGSPIQRQCQGCEEEEETLARKSAAEEEERKKKKDKTPEKGKDDQLPFVRIEKE